MSGWFDTHCHLDLLPAGERETARAAGVSAFLVPGIEGCSPGARRLANEHDDVGALAGWHPLFLRSWDDDCPARLARLVADDARIVGIGEVGLDRVPRQRPDDAIQEEAFGRQLEVAAALGCPVVVHLRGAFERFLTLAGRHPNLVYVMHCFSGSAEFATRLLGALPEVYFGFGGTATRPDAPKVHAALRAVPDDRLLVETDAPDLPPHGRPAPNTPANLPLIGRSIAALRGCPPEQLADQTWQNARRAFRWRIDSTG